MADWSGYARTNYFRVRDREAFDEAMAAFGTVEVFDCSGLRRWSEASSGARGVQLALWQDDESEPEEGSLAEYVGLGMSDMEGSRGPEGAITCWPQEDDEGMPTDFCALVASHLADGEVAVFQCIGREKLRYLTGFAVAINSEGEREVIDLDDLYLTVFRKWGISPTLCMF